MSKGSYPIELHQLVTGLQRSAAEVVASADMFMALQALPEAERQAMSGEDFQTGLDQVRATYERDKAALAEVERLLDRYFDTHRITAVVVAE